MVTHGFQDGSPGGGEPEVEGDVWNYIEDMLAQLADLAARNGRYDLATRLRLAAVDAAREGDD
jgi:hypothetical protein